MSEITAVFKEKADKIYILKDNRILIYQKNEHTLNIINQNTFKKESEFYQMIILQYLFLHLYSFIK